MVVDPHEEINGFLEDKKTNHFLPQCITDERWSLQTRKDFSTGRKSAGLLILYSIDSRMARNKCLVFTLPICDILFKWSEQTYTHIYYRKLKAKMNHFFELHSKMFLRIRHVEKLMWLLSHWGPEMFLALNFSFPSIWLALGLLC